MAALTIANQPSHLSLSRYITELPREKSNEFMSQSRWSNIASSVSMAALVAIAALAISTSIGVPILSVPPALLIALVIGTVPLQFAAAYFLANSAGYEVLAAAERGKANELEKIQDWTVREIKIFLKEHGISQSTLPMNALKQIDSKEPLRALLPAIARCRYWQQETEKQFSRYRANLYNECESLRNVGRSQAWFILEERLVPAALQAAFMLQIIAQPTLKTEWKNLGECRVKSFEQRTFERWLDDSDDYFIFQEPSKPRLTLKEICELIDPLKIDDLRLKLFPA